MITASEVLVISLFFLVVGFGLGFGSAVYWTMGRSIDRRRRKSKSSGNPRVIGEDTWLR